MHVDLHKDKLNLCLHFAKNASIGGYSNIRSAVDRKQKLSVDNFIGQVGTLAGCIFLYGEEQGIEEYSSARKLADKTPFSGDKGQDIIGKNIDIKCSYMRRSKNPEDYNVLIRPREVHPNWIYIQTLADKISNDGVEFIRVYIMGWVKTEDLPKNTETYGPFKGAYKLSVKKLKEFPIQ